jgi:hypothetical protein
MKKLSWQFPNLTSRLPFRFNTTLVLLQYALLPQEIQSSGIELIYWASMNPEAERFRDYRLQKDKFESYS